MKATIFLRVASVTALLQAVLHTIGSVFGTPSPGPAMNAVLAMKSNHFLLAGLARTYWDFYIGFALAITIALAAEGLILWLLSNMARTEGAHLRPILWVFLAGYVGLAVDAAVYLFQPPLCGDTFIALCLLMAIVTAKPAAMPVGALRAQAAD